MPDFVPRASSLAFSSLGLRTSLLVVFAIGTVACSGNGGEGGGAGSTGTAGTGGTTGTAGAGGTGGTVFKGCESATPILQPGGSPSGFVKCADGSVNRVEKVTCALQDVDTCQGTEDTLDCTTAADCQAQPGGVCLHVLAEGPGTGRCACAYQCETDADCANGQACVCAGVAKTPQIAANPLCAQAGDCTQPSDCGSGECGLGEWDKNCFRDIHLSCRSEDDACRTDDECGGAPTHECQKTDVTGTWTCTDPTCTI